MTISNYYRNATVLPAIIAIALTLLFSIIDNWNYKSEWLTAGSVVGLGFLTSFTYSLFMSVLCLPMLLLRLDSMRRNKYLTALVWFTLPFVWIATVVVREVSFSLAYDAKFSASFTFIILLNVPFIVGLIFTYWRYKKTGVDGHRLEDDASV